MHRWVHRHPPCGLPAQAATQGGQFWTPIGGQYSTPIDTHIVQRHLRAAVDDIFLSDHRGRAKRWNDDVAGLVQGQIEYAAWLDSLPDNLRDSPLAEALQAICDLDLTELQAIIPPRGFGRD